MKWLENLEFSLFCWLVVNDYYVLGMNIVNKKGLDVWKNKSKD